MIHVVVIIGRFHPFWGGAEIRMKQIAEALTSRGFKFTILTRRLSPNVVAHESLDGLEIYRLPKRTFLFHHAVRQWLKKNQSRIDIVHTIRTDKFGESGAWAHQKLGIPHITDIITNEAHRMLREHNYFGNRLWRKIMADTDIIHSINKENISFLISRGVPETQLWYQPNAVNPELFPFFDHPTSENALTVLYCGRFERLKGTDVLINAWKALPVELMSKTRLVLAGAGKWEKKIRDLASEIPNIELPGAVSRAKILEYYAEAQIYIHPSRYEGFGNAILEAMASGLPVIATEVGGIPDFVQSEVNGLLVRPDNAESLTEALIRLIENPALRQKMGRESRRIAVADFTFDRLFEAFETKYRSLAVNR